MNDRKSIVFHLGMPRTGTSDLQQTLRHNEKLLLDTHGILYPNLWGEPFYSEYGGRIPKGKSPAHEVFGNGLLTGKLGIHGAEQDIEDLFETYPAHTLVISTEVFTNVLCAPAINSFIELLTRLNQRYAVTTVITLREYASFVESMYLQSVITWNELDDFDTYLLKRLTWFELLSKGVNRLKSLAFLNVVIYTHNGTSIVSKFEDLLNIALPPLNSKKIAGEKLGNKSVALLYKPQRYSELKNYSFQDLYALIHQEKPLFLDEDTQYTVYKKEPYDSLYKVATQYANSYNLTEYDAFDINDFRLEEKQYINFEKFRLSQSDINLVVRALNKT